MDTIDNYYNMLMQKEKEKKQSRNKYNVCAEKSGEFDSFFEKQVFDNLTRMQKLYKFEFKHHTPEESIHWYTFNKWNKRYGLIGLNKDDICNDKIHHLYEPDFIVYLDNGEKFYIESKGHFPSTDRTKMKTLKKLHPELDIRMLFQKRQILKGIAGGKTNLEWALENEFKACVGGLLPKEWFKKEI